MFCIYLFDCSGRKCEINLIVIVSNQSSLGCLPILRNGGPKCTHRDSNIELPYLRNGSSDPFHVSFYGRVFLVSGSNGTISGLIKHKIASTT